MKHGYYCGEDIMSHPLSLLKSLTKYVCSYVIFPHFGMAANAGLLIITQINIIIVYLMYMSAKQEWHLANSFTQASRHMYVGFRIGLNYVTYIHARCLFPHRGLMRAGQRKSPYLT